MKLLYRSFIAGIIFAVGVAVILIEEWREHRKKKRLGAAYEGPLDARDDD